MIGRAKSGIGLGMHVRWTVLSLLLSVTAVASADPDPDRVASAREAPAKLTLFTSAGYLATSGANGGALGTGVRWAVARHFALGFDLGYGLLATGAGMQDRWWLVPSMAVVFPVGRVSFDVGAGLGLGTASGYASWSEYAAHPFQADWEFQLEPAARAHVIAAYALGPTLELFARAEAAALVLPHDASPGGTTNSTWAMFSLGTRFAL